MTWITILTVLKMRRLLGTAVDWGGESEEEGTTMIKDGENFCCGEVKMLIVMARARREGSQDMHALNDEG